MRSLLLVFCAGLASGCVFYRPDHFYALDSGQFPELRARSTFALQVNLRVSLPMMVDRSELVLTNRNGVTILEHERWAAPLVEQFSSALGQDIEARREDVIVISRSIAQPDDPTMSISVDVIQLSLQKTSGAKMEARWRSQRGGEVTQGRETFSSPAPNQSYEGLIQSLNRCIGSLADRLVAQLPQ